MNSDLYADVLKAEAETEAFIQMHPELELCMHNERAFMAELSQLAHAPAIADLERVYRKLTSQGKLILRYRTEEN